MPISWAEIPQKRVDPDSALYGLETAPITPRAALLGLGIELPLPRPDRLRGGEALLLVGDGAGSGSIQTAQDVQESRFSPKSRRRSVL